MISFLQNHPFPVEAYFESSLVLTFAIPKDELMNLIPSCLELDTFDDKWAFIAVALVQTKDLRPKGLPKIFGSDFYLVGYRVFVHYKTSQGKSKRGLFILKSETDKKRMEFLGNIFTHYKYTTTDINKVDDSNQTRINSSSSNFQIIYSDSAQKVSLPSSSPFQSWEIARKYAGPLPYTFSVNPDTKEVLLIKGVRKNWKPEPIKIIEQSFSFINEMKLEGIQLASAFITKNISYYWEKGQLDKCTK